jgi:hypothetical protein
MEEWLSKRFVHARSSGVIPTGDLLGVVSDAQRANFYIDL